MTSRTRHIAVTGAAGYLGRTLCAHLSGLPGVSRVVGIDRQPWPDEIPGGAPFDYHQLEITDEALPSALEGIDAVCHLAFLIDSAHGDQAAIEANVRGTRAVLDAAAQRGVQRLIVASSVSAYGALPDNPPRLTEAHPLRADSSFRYAHHKVIIERMLDRFERRHPGVRVVRLRIAVVLGPPPRAGAATDLLTAPALLFPAGFRVQFVHVDDVASAFAASLAQGARGAYNVAADPPLSGRDIARVTGQRYLPLPGALLCLAAGALRALQVKDPGRLDFVSHPLLVDTRRIQGLGWRPAYDGPACVASLLSGR